MKKIIKTFLLISVLTFSACSAVKFFHSDDSGKYVLGSDDIPLFSGLEFIADDSTSFDTMSGNIVVSDYLGEVKSKKVEKFYAKTLPQLGWKLISKQDDKVLYKRDVDKLEITFKQNGESLNVRFFISSITK